MRVIYPGHLYALQDLEADTETRLQFSQQAPLHEPVSGPSCQEVLRAIIDRVETLDKELPWPGNSAIIQNLREAIAGFEARALIRKAEKGLAIDRLPVGGDDHLVLAGGAA